MLVSKLWLVLILVKDRFKAIVSSHELMQLRRTYCQNGDQILDDYYLDVHNWLCILNLNKQVKLVDDLAITLSRLRHVATVQDVTAISSKQHLEEVVLKDFDVYRLYIHLVDGTTRSNFEMLGCEDIDPVNKVAFPVIIEQFCIADKETVHA